MNLVNRKLEIFSVAAFVVINLGGPAFFGEMYPFTISPMFSDQPNEYCVYRVRDENGSLIDGQPFGLHLVYDGNPPGLGMGIQAQSTLHGFGETATVEQLKQHVQAKLASMPERKFVIVERCWVRCVENRPEESIIKLRVDQLAVADSDDPSPVGFTEVVKP